MNKFLISAPFVALTFFGAGTANAGLATTEVVISITDSTIIEGEDLMVTVSAQYVGGSGCNMTGDIVLYVDGVAVDTESVVNTGFEGSSSATFTVLAPELGDHGVRAEFVQDAGSASPCYSATSGLEETVSVIAAPTTTTTEPELTAPPTMPNSVFADTGGRINHNYVFAAVAAMIAGAGAVLARRRTL